MKIIDGKFHIDPNYLDLQAEDLTKEPLPVILSRAASEYLDATFANFEDPLIYTSGTALIINLEGFCDSEGQNAPVLSVDLEAVFKEDAENGDVSGLVSIRDALNKIISEC